MLKLWSRRYSPARGWRWREERACSPENAEAWLRVFCADEPNVAFVVAARKPR